MIGSHFVIGMTTLSETIQFSRTVRKSIMNAALQYPNVTLLVRNAEMENDRALKHIEEFASIPVDLAIISHIDERFNRTLNSILLRHHIQTIAIDTPIPLTTYFGANHKTAGIAAGKVMGEWVSEHWACQIDKVLVMTDSRLSDVVHQRMDYELSTLSNYASFSKNDIFYLDGESQRSVSYERSLSVLNSWSEHQHIAILGVNDDCVLGAIEAARTLGREEDVVGVGHGATLLDEAFAVPHSRFIGSVDYFRDDYGTQVMALAMRLLRKERVPQVNMIEHVCVTPETYPARRLALQAGSRS